MQQLPAAAHQQQQLQNAGLGASGRGGYGAGSGTGSWRGQGPETGQGVARAEEAIWYKDLRGFLTEDNFLAVVPTGSMTYAQQLNSALRLTLYYAAAMSVIRLRLDSFILPVATAFLTYLLYEGSGGAGGAAGAAGAAGSAGAAFGLGFRGVDGFSSTGFSGVAGGLDGSGCSVHSSGHAFRAGAGLGDEACARPTRHNPFMNELPLDPARPPYETPSCDPLVPEVKSDMRDKFQRDLFRDTGDLFERGNSERQFYTVPSNQPEDQTAFAQWIYGDVRRGGKTSRPPGGHGSSSLTGAAGSSGSGSSGSSRKRECDFGDF